MFLFLFMFYLGKARRVPQSQCHSLASRLSAERLLGPRGEVSPPLFFGGAEQLAGGSQPALAAPGCAHALVPSWRGPAARVGVCRHLCEAITGLNWVLLAPPCLL